MQEDQVTINVDNPTKLDMLYMQRMTLQEQARRIQAEAIVNQNGLQQVDVQIKGMTESGTEKPIEPAGQEIQPPAIPIAPKS